MSLPIRRRDFDAQGFLAYLAEQGCEVGKPSNAYEVVRYRAYALGGKKPTTHLVYSKDSGLLTWMPGTQGHYLAFQSGKPLTGNSPPFVSQFDKPQPAQPGAAPEADVPASKQAKVRAKLRARDGDDCWFCGDAMGTDCTIEHLVPRSKGGSDKLDNYALAHAKCNRDAANKPLVVKIELRAKMRSEMRNWSAEKVTQ